MKPSRIALLASIFCLTTSCQGASGRPIAGNAPAADTLTATKPALLTGAEHLEQLLPLLKGKRVGLIVNQTSIVGSAHTHLLDTLIARGVDVRSVFAPEHGFRGDADAGEKVADGRDRRTGLPITSLYGRTRKPTPEMLAGLDVLVFDIQDVGARFYTYISTMLYAMEAAAEQGKAFVVLDRPNPNDTVDGPMLDPAQRSFVGAMPIPLLHGMTVGELARMIVGEGWIASAKGAPVTVVADVAPTVDSGFSPTADSDVLPTADSGFSLTVVALTGWHHGEPYSLPVKPSPNLPNDLAIRLYPSLCLFEATKVSVGRGTAMPFQVVGYPDARYGSFTFTPTALPGSDKNPLQKDRLCYGLDLRSDTTTRGFDLTIFEAFLRKTPDGTALITSPSFFDRLAGTSLLRQQLLRGDSLEAIRQSWQPALDAFRAKRAKYLIYEED